MVLDRLLDPEHGCPWDRKQTPETIRLYILEETYELIEAVEADNVEDIREELGDCIFLIAFLSRLFKNKGDFNLAEVLDGAAEKMIARHPHIFSNGRTLENAEQVRAQWHEIKKQEKKGSILDSVPKNLPALLKTHRLTERAGRLGFDWKNAHEVMDSVDQELAELREAISNNNPEETAAELGDVIFTLGNLARHLKINAEHALRATNDRFTGRFKYIEDRLAEQGRNMEEAELAEMDELWEEAKAKGL